MQQISRWMGLVKTLAGGKVQGTCGEDHPSRRLDLSKYDLVDLLLRDLCNGFGIRDSHGECYAYGSYPMASFFNHSWYATLVIHGSYVFLIFG